MQNTLTILDKLGLFYSSFFFFWFVESLRIPSSFSDSMAQYNFAFTDPSMGRKYESTLSNKLLSCLSGTIF